MGFVRRFRLENGVLWPLHGNGTVTLEVDFCLARKRQTEEIERSVQLRAEAKKVRAQVNAAIVSLRCKLEEVDPGRTALRSGREVFLRNAR